MNDLKVTSIEELKKCANGELVELPAFSEDCPFVARLRRPSMMKLVQQKKIPNPLLQSANELFAGGVQGAFDEENAEAMNELFQLMDIICEASFVEPKYSDLKEAGIELTDEQLLFVFNYGQRGVKGLESFRQE